MRTVLRSLLAVAALAACTPGSVIVVREPVSNPRPAPRPAPAPAPAPTPVAPLEVDIGRPHRGQLLVQTNRAAYVALFEIIPDQGVTLVHPSTPRERRFMVSGPRRMPTWFEESNVTTASREREPVRYIYALASDEPLRITDEAFHAGYLRRVLGPITYRGTNPYSTMRAIAARFAPNVRDERWAEDVFVLDSRRRGEPQHVARVYCPGGVILEIPEELADRAWCPGRRAGRPVAQQPGVEEDEPAPARPDSVKGNNGRRVQMRAHGTPGEQPRSRVRESMTVPAPVQPAASPAPAPENPASAPGEAQDKPGQRRGQDEDRPGQRRGQTEDKPGNGPPASAPAAAPAQAATTADSTVQGSRPGNRGRSNSGQQQDTRTPGRQHSNGAKPETAAPQSPPAQAAAAPQGTQPTAPQSAPPAAPSQSAPPQAAQPATEQPQAEKPAPSAQAQGRGQSKKAAADSTAAPDTSSQGKPGRAKPPAAGRPPAPQG